MPQINFKMPLSSGVLGNFDMNDNTKDAIRENVKLTILTTVGERIISDIGSNFHFDTFKQTKDEIQAAITEHITEIFDKFFNFLKIENITILVQEDNLAIEANSVYVKLVYSFKGVDNFIDQINFVL